MPTADEPATKLLKSESVDARSLDADIDLWAVIRRLGTGEGQMTDEQRRLWKLRGRQAYLADLRRSWIEEEERRQARYRRAGLPVPPRPTTLKGNQDPLELWRKLEDRFLGPVHEREDG